MASYQRGLVLLQEAATRAPHIAEIRYHMAAALVKVGRNAEAHKELGRVLKDHADFNNRSDAAELYEQLKREPVQN